MYLAKWKRTRVAVKVLFDDAFGNRAPPTRSANFALTQENLKAVSGDCLPASLDPFSPPLLHAVQCPCPALAWLLTSTPLLQEATIMLSLRHPVSPPFRRACHKHTHTPLHHCISDALVANLRFSCPSSS